MPGSRRRVAVVVTAAVLAVVASGCLDEPPPLDPDLAAPASLPAIDVAAPGAPASEDIGTGSGAEASEAASGPTDPAGGDTTGDEAELTLRGSSPERAARELTLRVRASGCGEVRTGSGFALSDDVLVTNRHVVEGGTNVQVNTWDGRSASAAFVAAAFEQDLAIVRLDADLPRTGDLAADDPEVGDAVTVVGYPGGGTQELADGEVVGYVEAVSQGREIHSMQITAPAAPGSSGGPVLDEAGDVAGVVYALEIESGHTLAMPASTLRGVLDGGGDVGAPVRC